MFYRTINPATEQLVQWYPDLPTSEAKERAKKGALTFKGWCETQFDERRELILKLSSHLRERRVRFSSLITEEMGKPIDQAEAEIDKCICSCEFYAENAEKFLMAEVIPTDATKSYVRYDPLGVILGIMPWNFPFWQVFRFAIPTIMAGNAVLIKPAPNVPACAIAIDSLFQGAGFPEDLFQTLLLSDEATAQLIASPLIQGVSLTGSDRAGREIASLAGKSLKRMVLELGGADPFIVLEDADLTKVVPMAIRSRMLNSGQSCIAAKRFLIVEKIFSRFEEMFLDAVKNLTVGDPTDRSTRIGPIARQDLLQNLVRQVEDSVSQGAKLVIGGRQIERKGYFYLPTVLEGVRPKMAAFDQEIFGPVASLIAVKGEEEAIELANETSYGLGASLWSRNIPRAEALALEIEAGSVFINGMVKSDPRLPFGGIKQSGYGRELGVHGLKEFCNVKTVWIA